MSTGEFTARGATLHKASQNCAEMRDKARLIPRQPVLHLPGTGEKRYGFEALLKALHEFALVVDGEGRILSVWSSNRERSPLVETALVGTRLRDFLDKDAWNHVQVLREAAAGTRPQERIIYSAQLPGGTRWFAIWVIPGAGEREGATPFCLGTRDITERARAGKELHRLSQQLMRAHDDSRRHLARDLHESAGQSLAALKMTLGNLREALPGNGELAYELLQSAVELAEEAVREVRTISYLMHPPMLDEAGLASALRWYAEGFSKRSGIDTTVCAPESFGRYPQEIETTAFRIVQEALTNVHRYSGSKTARITLAGENGHVRAEVCDEGCGIARPRGRPGTAHPPGVGLQGMRERVAQLNGMFEIETEPGKGTTIRAILPVKGNPSAQHASGHPITASTRSSQRRKAHHASR